MATILEVPDLYSCGHKLDEGDNRLGTLNSTYKTSADPETLRDRMAEDGYLFLRSYLNRDEVLAARRHILEQLAADGQLDPSAAVMDGVPKAGTKLFFQPELAQKNNPPLQHLLYSPQGNLMEFFRSFLGVRFATSTSHGCAVSLPVWGLRVIVTLSTWAVALGSYSRRGYR